MPKMLHHKILNRENVEFGTKIANKKEFRSKTSKQAHKLPATLLRNYEPPTYLLTGVRCRATGVAKNLNGEYVDDEEDDGDGVSSHLGSV